MGNRFCRRREQRFQTDQTYPVYGKVKLNQTAQCRKTRQTCHHQSRRKCNELFSPFWEPEKVYHKKKDDHLALQDGLETERPEPQNAGIRKQKERLQTDKMEFRAGVVDQKTSDGASIAECTRDTEQTEATAGELCTQEDEGQDHYEVEIIYEGQDEISTLRDNYKSCPKSARHPEYIPVPEFCMEHLPLQYRSERLMALVKAQVKLTVLIRVGTTSDTRAEYFPSTDKNARRLGSGCVINVKEYPKEEEKGADCPCNICERSGKPSKSCAAIQVVTAAHLVLDMVEGRKSVCYFDYDSNSTDLRSCRQLRTAEKVKSNGVHDISHVLFITHDLEWARQLKETVNIYWGLCSGMELECGVKDNDDVSGENLLDNISVLHREYERLEKFSEWIDRWRNMTKTEAERRLEEYKCKYNMQTSDSVMPHYRRLLENTICDDGDDEWRQELSGMSSVHKSCEDCTAVVSVLKDNYQSFVRRRGVQWMMDMYREYRYRLEKLNGFVAHVTDDEIFVICELPYYTPSNPSTIIVSHPHGLCKQISIGQAMTRYPHQDHHMASYSYTATTCTGSSGAQVYILGAGMRWWGPPARPHSESVQINLSKSAVIYD